MDIPHQLAQQVANIELPVTNILLNAGSLGLLGFLLKQCFNIGKKVERNEARLDAIEKALNGKKESDK
jgi:hypothetical protein